MKVFILYFLLPISLQITIYAQPLNGVWQGILYNSNYENPKIIYLNIEVNETKITGSTKEEWYISDLYTLKNMNGKMENKKITITETTILQKKTNAKVNLCNYNFELNYDAVTGYLSGNYSSSTCRNVSGYAKFYHSKLSSINTPSPIATHSWVDQLIKDLKKGRKAPDKQEEDRTNFKFQTLYFDYDKDEIRPEYYEYLKKMADIVDGHSDLRILVIGHTDGDGSDLYNIDLSKRRAQNIQNYFKSLGIEDFKVIIDFKGKKMPIDTNHTPEGKQRNRRVDFQFI